ncbi:Lrp/AsnC family transcriptional regulator [Streptomyces sp. NBRC 109706]|uniref:Lrp/AsnC family transcriptional regulator n=1 Tax=Streptomyces sp. NBRC 109706 TaxID=1550035 RepID=UPI0007806185|nr:Lrp/AsnC family transcriptional regulator [Streptomyces sp. NBRC 109706]
MSNVSNVSKERHLDATDARILRALNHEPRATVLALAQRLGLSRNTVQARMTRLEREGVLRPFECRIDPAALGYPLTAFVTAEVEQRRLTEVGVALTRITEVTEIIGLSGDMDLLIRVIASDAEDLYRVAGHILACPGVLRTRTSLAMRELLPLRLTQVLDVLADDGRH